VKTLSQYYPEITLYRVIGPPAILIILAYTGILITLPKLREIIPQLKLRIGRILLCLLVLVLTLVLTLGTQLL
jgi:hypothetical protein